MARIQSGGFNLRKEWQSLEEIVGASLHMLEPLLVLHEIKVELPPEMVLINCDGQPVRAGIHQPGGKCQ
ncbi:Sensor protein KdpD [Serratia fonticola]|uniref:Sensor protein KdpD n=1 Tax=Serratia fonticola TaxID=47917 RepID=A0A4U9TXZ8_SERFO|nr:Sensor protein KdpD [Serratia fonticola]